MRMIVSTKNVSLSFLTVVLIGLLVGCFHSNSIATKNVLLETSFSPGTQEHECPYPVQLGTVYGTGISPFDKTILMFTIKQLLLDLCEGHFSHLLSFVHKETGLFVDAKGYWKTEEVKADLQDSNGYFALYYFDSEKLDLKKGTKGNLTIRDVFGMAGAVYVDIFVGSKEEVEVKFRFPKDPKLERYLINPNFIKIKNTWYLHRMF